MSRLEELLQQRESDKLDFKRDMSSLNGITKDICAFANTAGGILAIGIEDDRTVIGIDNPEQAEEQLMNIIADRLEPRPTVQIEYVEHNNMVVILVQLAFQEGPIHLKGKPEEEGTYGRYGSSSRKVDEGRLAELRNYRDARAWDERACIGAGREDFNDTLAENIFDQQGAEYSESSLRTCKLLVDKGGELVPTNAGIILFGHDRAKYSLDNARWRCGRYPGLVKSSDSLSFVDFEDKTVLEALNDVSTYIREQVGTVHEIKGLTRVDKSAISENVIREILVNAIAHANYQVKGHKLDVSIYSDRVEVQSPGNWPPAYWIDDFRAGISKPRNTAIARTLRTLGYMEERGTAWARIQEAVPDGYPEPNWETFSSALRVTIPKHEIVSIVSTKNETIETKADGRSAKALERQHQIMTTLIDIFPEDMAVKEIADTINTSRPTVFRDVQTLVTNNVIERTSRGRVKAKFIDH